ncbi:phosphatase domain-containing protein [Taibaiella koreensis]|uniref:phosphatase domain-containing protein n=1 Tax=Taibaiella koreensis TaxID=1268548 RepID=UPI000E5A091E|nr:AAA family ATPase [Taibaiella koreensis]
MSKTPQLLILIGAPGSGKSTFARYHLRTQPNWMRLSRDDFRQMHFTYAFMEDQEERKITRMIDAAITSLLAERTNVILDATHTKKKYLDEYIDKFNTLADIHFKVFEAPEEVLYHRCEARYAETGKQIPRHAIQKHVANLQQLKKEFDFEPVLKKKKVNQYREQDPDLPRALICDLDGTLALLNGRDPYNAASCEEDQLNQPVANLLVQYRQLGYRILLVSGREDIYKAQTLRFLERHGILFDELLMRKEKDSRKDAFIKKELFKAYIEGKYFVEFVLDDRNQVVDMWREELMLPCFQVFYGDF